MEGTRVCSVSALLGVLAAAPVAADVVINEVHYDPPDKTVPAEFVELYNSGAAALDLSGWFFADGIEYTFGAGTVLAPGGYLVVAQSPAALENLHGDLPVVGPFAGRLDNDGEVLVLRDRDGPGRTRSTTAAASPGPSWGAPPATRSSSSTPRSTTASAGAGGRRT